MTRANNILGKIVEVVLWSALATLTVLIPNAFKEIAVGILVATSLYYAIIWRVLMNKQIFIIWMLVAAVTIFYTLVGSVNGAPLEASEQVIVIYIISPALWIIALRGALVSFRLEHIVQFLLLLSVLAMLSQAFYYWLFLKGSASGLLEIMASSPNLTFKGGDIAATMFVFGSMIFLYAGFMASPSVLGSKLMRILFMLAVFISSATSGRSALVLSVIIGSGVSIVLSLRSQQRVKKGVLIGFLCLSTIGLFCCYWILSNFYGIDALISLNTLVEKISSGGGAGRQDYLPQLIVGAFDRFMLGAGHGIGIEYVASDEFPWRYEVVGAATLYRVGFLGTIAYILPFVLALRNAFRRIRMVGLDRYEAYLFGGLLAALVSANTNPYIEAVVFQWMFVLPTVYFLDGSVSGWLNE